MLSIITLRTCKLVNALLKPPIQDETICIGNKTDVEMSQITKAELIPSRFFYDDDDYGEEEVNRIYLVDLTPHAVYPVCAGVIGVVVHLLGQNPGELVVHGVRERGECRPAVRLDEPPVDVLQEREGNAP